jgi:Family of unknown function (DUF6132)
MSMSTRWHKLSRSHGRTFIGALCGVVAGALYAHFVGCRTGSCPITSSIWTSALYGGAVGVLAGWPNRKA